MTGKKLIVIGGGAAGFFCAVNAARLCPGLQVTILEKQSKLLSKVRVSGGGRCNVTHACFDITEMAKRYPRGKNFVKRSFHRFFTTDTIAWFEERGVKLKAEKDGRMFPVTDNSESIINCLLREADKYGVQVSMGTTVVQVAGSRLQVADGEWQVAGSGLQVAAKIDSFPEFMCRWKKRAISSPVHVQLCLRPAIRVINSCNIRTASGSLLFSRASTMDYAENPLNCEAYTQEAFRSGRSGF